MQLKIQKRLAAQILKTSKNNIQLDSSRLEEIKEAITKADIKSLIKEREKYRKEKNFREADKIREKINKLGFVLEDTEKGVLVKKR